MKTPRPQALLLVVLAWVVLAAWCRPSSAGTARMPERVLAWQQHSPAACRGSGRGGGRSPPRRRLAPLPPSAPTQPPPCLCPAPPAGQQVRARAGLKLPNEGDA